MATHRLWLSMLLASGAAFAQPVADGIEHGEPAPLPPAPLARTWMLNEDARVPERWQAVVFSRFSYSGGDSISRPFAGDLSLPRQSVEVGGELGLGRGFSLQMTGVQSASAALDAGGGQTMGALFGVRWAVLAGDASAPRLTLSAGVLRDLTQTAGAWTRLTYGQDLGRLRLTASGHAEHLFAAGRDGVDLLLSAGASWRLTDSLRLGAEYVGQDLEETFDDGAEGGARHLIGPVASASFLGERLSLVAGPAFALGAQAGRVLVRGGVAFSF